MEFYKSLQQKPFIIAGPCAMEGREMALELAENLKQIAEKHGFTYIFKASFDKANRTSHTSYRGLGMEKCLEVFEEIKQKFGVPVLTDVHESHQAPLLEKVVDVIQIPAFLCRQTDLLEACAKTNRVINIKKAQFLSAADMKNVVEKMKTFGNEQILLCERGTMFGYNNLVVDYTGLIEMQQYEVPVVMDATHSVQKPGGLGGKTGGNRDYAPLLAYAAASVGVKGFFFEVHQNPEIALSDGPNQIYLSKFDAVVEKLKKFVEIA
jgi:2-dehydro-3-deoxyphosphooctonate aldolase (KDO 8-P synthase)